MGKRSLLQNMVIHLAVLSQPASQQEAAELLKLFGISFQL